MERAYRGVALVIALAGVVSACSAGDSSDSADSGPGAPGDTGASGDAAMSGMDAAPSPDVPAGEPAAPADIYGDVPVVGDSRAAYCMGAGPPILVGDSLVTGARCLGHLAEAAFRYGICTCTDLALAGYMHTDSFDSARGGYAPGERGGAVGINGALGLIGVMRVGDSLTHAGTDSLRLVGAHTVRGDLGLQGDLNVIGTFDVERNARERGAITALGPYHVHGDLTTPPGAASFGFIQVDGARRTAPVDIAPPCACGAAEVIDIAGIVREGQRANDNAAVGFNPQRFNAVIGLQTTVLPCGRFYAEHVAGLGGITLQVAGRTALFVGGDFDLGGELDVQLGPSGELDVFIAGSVLGAGYLRLGRVSRPSRVRFYIGGSQGFTLAGASGFYGNIYAPHAPVTLAGYMNLYGALFAGRITAGADLDVHYDRSIITAGEGCPDVPVPGGCTGCGTGVCRTTQACTAGHCGTCRADGDCCAPLVCETRTGQCLPLPP